jgi:hypothetical protein
MAFGQQSPLQALDDSLFGDANFHAAFKMVWPQPERLGPVKGHGSRVRMKLDLTFRSKDSLN